VLYEGVEYKLFQDAQARVTYVVGEFYWKVAVGERVNSVDWIRPPFGISKEMTTSGAQEIAYSHARYLTRKEIEEAFHVEGLNRPVGVGPMQPYTGPKLLGAWLAMFALLLVVAMGLGVVLPDRLVLRKTFDLAAEPPVAGGPDNGRVAFSEPFELSGNYNVAVKAKASLDNTWVFIAGDLVDDSTGGLYSFELPLEYYSGVDQGESWSEGSRAGTKYLARPDKGRYTLRLETQWEAGKQPPPVTIEVREGVFRVPYFILALLAISILPLLSVIRQFSFEKERWKDSGHSPYASQSSDDDEEE
jgi:hypothetical protein